MYRVFLGVVLFGASAHAAADLVNLDRDWQVSSDGGAWLAASIPPCFDTRNATPNWQRSLNIPISWRDRHVRLRLLTTAPSSTVLLDDMKLERAGNDYDLTPFLQAGRASQLKVRLSCDSNTRCGIIEAVLMATPRVFLASESVRVDGSALEVETMVRNTLDNTANVDIHWELSYQGKIATTAGAAVTVPPLLSSPASIRLTPAGGLQLWGIHDPKLYKLRTIMVKNAEAVEGDYDMESETGIAARTIERGEQTWTINSERIALAGAVLQGSCYPDRNQSKSALETMSGIVGTGGLPVASWVQSQADQAGILVTDAPIHEKSPGARVKVLSARLDHGDTVVEIENPVEMGNYTLRRIQMTVGHVSKVVEELKPGERRQLRFENVNPYRIEVKAASGLVLASE